MKSHINPLSRHSCRLNVIKTFRHVERGGIRKET